MAEINDAALFNAKYYTKRLDPGEVRLLSFEESSGKWSFETHTLGQAPPYVAVSYTWGPNEDVAYADDAVINKDGVPRYLSTTDRGGDVASSEAEAHFLEIDGESYQVTQNVHELVTRVMADGVGALGWIDALCINQADHVERSSQVRRMGDIFATAEYVLIWLGTDDRGEAEIVVDMCKAIQAEYRRQIGSGGRNADVRKIPNFWEPGVLEQMGLPSAVDDRWHVLARFWDRRWFHRTWVVQEAAAANSQRFWWGATDLDVQMLTDVSKFILQSQLPLFARRNASGTLYNTNEWFTLRRKIGESIAKIQSFKHLVFTQPGEIDGQPYLMDSYDLQCTAVGGPKMIDGKLRKDCMRYWANMLETNRTFDASDRRDYIYATLGIIDTGAMNRDWSMTGIVVDYTKSVAEVYTDAAKRIMEASKCVNLISLAQDPQMRREHDLPSWVPDFSARGEMPIMLPRARRWSLMPNLYKMAHSVPGSLSSSFEVQDDLRTLRVQGIRLDEVLKIGESHYDLYNGGMWEKVGQILLSRPSFAPHESRIESLWRTMIANSSMSEDDIAPLDTAALFKLFVTYSLAMRALNDPTHLDKLPTWQKLTDMELAACNYDNEAASLPSFEYVRDRVEYSKRVIKELEAGGAPPKDANTGYRAGLFGNAAECMYYRRILVNKSGYLGFGPMSTMPGDEVWLLPGMPLPTILRKVDGEGSGYKVLGESYLHGDPDFMAQQNEKGWQWIELV